jgi:CBS domain-containing protein
MRPKATLDTMSLRQLQEKREALRGVELFSYSEELRSVMVSPVLVCSPTETIKDAVERMASKKTSSIVVVDEDEEPLGIVTDRDIMRRIVAVGRFDIGKTPVSEVMTPQPLTLTPDDTVYHALFLLSSRGIKHLPLVASEAIGERRLVGIVTLRQLLKLRYPEPMTLIAGIAGAHDVATLAGIRARLPRVAATRLSRGSRAHDVAVMLSLVNQDIHRRAFEMALEQTGEPPVECCLFVTGSHGRLENLLVTDQDYGLVLAETGDERQRSEADEFYSSVAEIFTASLERVGFERCPGEVMAVNDQWRKDVAGWKAQLEQWIVDQVPHLGRYLTVFFDAAPIWGQKHLFAAVQERAFELLGSHYEVFRILHEEEGGHRVPTGLLGRFITERRGEHRGEFDIKRSGLIFVVEAVRILALLHDIRETPTLKRIAKLVGGGHLNADDGEYFEGAFRFLLHFALDSQVEEAMRNEEIDTYVNPSLMSSRNREMLRHAYKAVTKLQELIAIEFGELII